MKTHSILVTLISGLSLCACATDADAPSSEQPDIAGQGIRVENRLVASIDLSYGKLEFFAVAAPDGTDYVYALEMSSAYVSETPVDDLMARENPTNLELFLAVAPGQEAPKELVDAQAREATLRHRSDATVRTVTFDRDAPVKKSTAACTSWQYLLPERGSNYYYTRGKATARNYLNGSQWMPLGSSTSDWNYHHHNNVSLGVCNDSTTETAHMHYGWDIDNNGVDTWYYGESAVFIPPGGMAKQFNFNNSYWSGLTPHPAKYIINGYLPTQAMYHLRAVEFIYNPIIL